MLDWSIIALAIDGRTDGRTGAYPANVAHNDWMDGEMGTRYLSFFFFFFSFLFFFSSIPFIISPLYSLPPSRNSDPGSRNRLFSPLPTAVRVLHFNREKISAISSSSTRVELWLCIQKIDHLGPWEQGAATHYLLRYATCMFSPHLWSSAMQ